ncbi:hypothetical protein BT93_L3101 [Corymbia citriodora subsp. variegata]|uniref:F-box domain-containing protein n=1 Tax=Corymbia citriodora subsp. variegata TaxID=360336 RepID=A0A8T0CJB2_CORYI|nr:hypothetical protein BT93_L3101 [Corymbia citriodora subsp. variegata]
MARNWADLPEELLQLCSQHLCPKDLQALRAVCRSWRSAALEERSDVPWLMLTDEAEPLQREFLCPSCRLVHKAPVPGAKARRCFSSRGWLFALGWDGELHMLKNPMSSHHHIIKLPNLDKFLDISSDDGFYAKFVLSASPTTSPDYVVMVIYWRFEWLGPISAWVGRLGLWKPSNKKWTTVNSPYPSYDVLLSFQFMAYDDVIEEGDQLMLLDPYYRLVDFTWSGKFEFY